MKKNSNDIGRKFSKSYEIASFATAVAGRGGSGVWVSLRAHKARGDGRDRLFRFESIQAPSTTTC